MLESQILWISTTQAASGERSHSAWKVSDGPDAAELGRIVAEPFGWLPWRVVRRWAAYELPDMSAIFAGLRAGLFPRDWNVVEADGRLVGMVRGPHLLQADGEMFARVTKREAHTVTLSAPDNSVVVRWQLQKSGLRIEFADSTAEVPFAKMVALIAAMIDAY
jgi:hypothetical protein